VDPKGKTAGLQKSEARLRIQTCLFFLFLLFCFPALCQIGTPLSTPTASRPDVPEDALGRTTPRGTVLGFLNSARKGDYELAARYLDTRLRGKASTDLAHQLFLVLDRKLPARLNQLSDVAEGSLSNPLKPDQELVGTISSDSGNVDIIVKRVDREKSGSLWMFSSETLNSIPNLYEEVTAVSVDSVLPDFLVNARFAGIALFEWLAVFVCMPLFYLLTTLLNRVLSRLVGQWWRRLRRNPNLSNPEVLPGSIRLLLLAVLIRWLLTKLSLPLLARQFWFSTATIITISGCVGLLILLNGRVERFMGRHLQGRNLTGATSVLRLARRAIDGLIVFAGVLVALYHFGVKPTAALAGLGVGGLAVAFAAQKTLENVIAGVSLIFDRAVGLGDTLKLGDTVGTVKDIGLLSTWIRTLDRTLVAIPNGQIANMSLENVSARDKFWFHPILSLRCGTTSQQMHAVLAKIRSLLAENRQVEPDSIRVSFLRFGLSSLDVEVFAYVLARDWNQFLELQETLLLQIMERVESSGVQIALPSQIVFMAAASASTATGMEGLLKVPALDKKTDDGVANLPALPRQVQGTDTR
jgi:MscS family membrane protein